MTEPIITINGRRLTDAQAAAVRVAITSFHADMATPMALGSDEHGIRMTEAYRDRLTEVLEIDRAGRVSTVNSAQERALLQMQNTRINRVLQLAGIVPEQARPKVREMAGVLILEGLSNDAAATRLREKIDEAP